LRTTTLAENEPENITEEFQCAPEVRSISKRRQGASRISITNIAAWYSERMDTDTNQTTKERQFTRQLKQTAPLPEDLWVSSHDFSMRYAEGLVVGSTW